MDATPLTFRAGVFRLCIATGSWFTCFTKYIGPLIRAWPLAAQLLVPHQYPKGYDVKVAEYIANLRPAFPHAENKI